MSDWVREDDRPTRDKEILGRDSGPRLAYTFGGVGFCGTGSVKFFPETRSAVVALTSGLNAGDAAEFTNLVLIQELFDLQPRVDILEIVKREVVARKDVLKRTLKDVETNRDLSVAESNISDYVGEYSGLGISLDVRKDLDKKRLKLCFNKREDLVVTLEHYGEDLYCYLPKTRDEWLAGGWLDWDYPEVSLLRFHRNEDSKQVTGAAWIWERGAEPFMFKRADDDGSQWFQVYVWIRSLFR